MDFGAFGMKIVSQGKVKWLEKLRESRVDSQALRLASGTQKFAGMEGWNAAEKLRGAKWQHTIL